ncbi:hypothetical protein [Aeromonas veronii]|uniref:Uncharacterized protein n=1 Tax=Aeromonas veronii TaxID=654 RepID=A0A2T4MWL6_AERVE|nr:hypothetical protein [Aeromonas veronii]PTH78954.1 hypothetical protein DAA48_21180 [Aeromonas veronii]
MNEEQRIKKENRKIKILFALFFLCIALLNYLFTIHMNEQRSKTKKEEQARYELFEQQAKLGGEIKDIAYDWAMKNGDREKAIALNYNTCLANSKSNTQMSKGECLQMTGDRNLISKVVDVIKKSNADIIIKVDFAGDELFK